MPHIYDENDRQLELAYFRRQRPWPMGDRLPLKRNHDCSREPRFAMLHGIDDGLEIAYQGNAEPEPTTPELLIEAGWVTD